MPEDKILRAVVPYCPNWIIWVYSVVVILYRVATFNDCNEAAIELKQQIEEARKDLKSKGFKFD